MLCVKSQVFLCCVKNGCVLMMWRAGRWQGASYYAMRSMFADGLLTGKISVQSAVPVQACCGCLGVYLEGSSRWGDRK